MLLHALSHRVPSPAPPLSSAVVPLQRTLLLRRVRCSYLLPLLHSPGGLEWRYEEEQCKGDEDGTIGRVPNLRYQHPNMNWYLSPVQLRSIIHLNNYFGIESILMPG
jgi:hypothetical protein